MASYQKLRECLGAQADPAVVAAVIAVIIALGIVAIALVVTYLSSLFPFIILALAVVTAIVFVGVTVGLHRYISPKTPTEKREYVQTLGLFIGGLVGIVGLYVAWVEITQSRQNTMETLQNAQEVEKNRANEAALQSYLEHMQTLIAEHDLGKSDAEAEVIAAAQAQTLSLFFGLDDQRKQRPLLFLYAANLLISA